MRFVSWIVSQESNVQKGLNRISISTVTSKNTHRRTGRPLELSTARVRQPLTPIDSNFDRHNYATQRVHREHIAYLNHPSFMNMAKACGREPLYDGLLPPWELRTGQAKSNSIKLFFVRMNLHQASHFLSDFYLMGAFTRITVHWTCLSIDT